MLHPSYSPLCAIIIYLVQGTVFEAIYCTLFSCAALRPNCSCQHPLYISHLYKTEVKLWVRMFKLNVCTGITQRQRIRNWKMIDGASRNKPAFNSFVNVIFCSECGGRTVQATRPHVLGESCLPSCCIHNVASTSTYTIFHCARFDSRTFDRSHSRVKLKIHSDISK